MCAPLAMAGLQIASTLAQGAADARALRRDARAAREAAAAEAARHAAAAERVRDDAGRDSATARARAATTATDPLSESLVATLADGHARRMDPALDHEDAARDALAAGESRAATLRRASRNAIYRSLLGSATALAGAPRGGNVIAIPY